MPSACRFTDWFLAEGGPEDEEDGNGERRRSKATARLDERRSEAWLCTQCGCVHRDEADACLNPQCAQPGPLARIYLVHEPKAFRCLGCGAHRVARARVATTSRSGRSAPRPSPTSTSSPRR